ncbi:MAG: M28 family peptidase, partial [Gemmatimonadota bacterium]
LDKAIANLNLDMIGRNDPATVDVIRQSTSDLGQLVQTVAGSHPDIGVSPIDRPDDQLVRRSDCFAFLLEGIDALFFHSGLHDDYHGLNDEPDRLNAGKAAAVARLAYWVGVELVK